eukprot:1791498-Amphidinium_carterae.2
MACSRYKEVDPEVVETAAMEVIGSTSCVLDFNDFSTVIDLYDEVLDSQIAPPWDRISNDAVHSCGNVDSSLPQDC